MKRDLEILLRRYDRVAIVGGPRMGKSTLAQSVKTDRPVIGADDYKDMPWEEIPLAMIRDIAPLPRFLVEGVMVPRALRKGLEVDAVVLLTVPKVPNRLPGQIAMAKGVRTVFDEWHRAHTDVPVFLEAPQ